MDRARKETVVDELNLIFTQSGVVVIAHYSGMTVANMSELRHRMREANGAVRVAKNKLSKIALMGKSNEGLVKFLEGQTVLIYSEDPVVAAKVAVGYSKDNESLKILGGALGDEIMDSAGIIAVSKMPSREELIASIAGCLVYSGNSLSQIIGSPGSNIGSIITAVEEKKAA
jgi:large subunit ribosomal protein L10